MIDPNVYLESAKTQEVAADFQAKGYEVIFEPLSADPHIRYDLVATKPGRKVVVEVKARSLLRESARAIRRLREQALAEGFDEFRLVVVNPPRERTIEIPHINQLLLAELVDDVPQELVGLSSQTQITGVSDVDIENVEITTDYIRIMGTALVEVDLEWGGGGEAGDSYGTDFPLYFDVTLDHDLHIEEVHRLSVDTSSYIGGE